MLINPMGPQDVWDGLPTSGDVFASQSHFSSNSEWKILQELVLRQLKDSPILLDRFLKDLGTFLSQSVPQSTMDDQQWLQQIAGDSGDEPYLAESFYNSYFPAPDASTSYARAQTSAAGVSAVNVRRDYDPSHIQQYKQEPPATGDEQMFLPNTPTANAYSRGYGPGYDTRQPPWQAYNTGGIPGGISGGVGFIDFHPDGLPSSSSAWPQPGQAVFGEPLDNTQVSPSSFSSTHSSTTSDAMAAMSLDTMTVHGDTTGNPQASGAVPGPDNSANTWTPSYPTTIAPKMLQIHPSPTPNSSSESIPTTMIANGGDADLGSSAYDNTNNQSRTTQSPRPAPKLRKELPDRPARLRNSGSASSSSKPSSSSKGKENAAASQSRTSHTHRHRHHQQPQAPQKTRVEQLKREKQDDAPRRVPVPDAPTPASTARNAHSSGSASANTNANATASPATSPPNKDGRAAKDDFLVRSRMAGVTYREIRRKGNFSEAESTLRGRFRTLTKDKEARVRKPEWQENDIRLLKKAVRQLHKGGDDLAVAKAPWGQVADYIVTNGGSYQFGGATCHRKWKELVEEGEVGRK
ncbi:uncharacterized protein F4822DRAFT_26716 [Hypoxylon trugodes]|uniref:uncharacterized protein n=1 Tax=Hypoxylon trugodes TaxID=326681 RepID=UPI0021918F31|nr:uncharacterized protein F4822DRAFT_26716 [Hypoxylon trugodes]KAI1393818.1 hypothetical protein F4822DRAFT_26716 [Hypoxylon trugodes]